MSSITFTTEVHNLPLQEIYPSTLPKLKTIPTPSQVNPEQDIITQDSRSIYNALEAPYCYSGDNDNISDSGDSILEALDKAQAEEDRQIQLHTQAAYHAELVRLGGRPALSLETLDLISQDPDSHEEQLAPWQVEIGVPYGEAQQQSESSELSESYKPTVASTTTIKWDVFGNQLSRWWHFRRFQQRVRGLPFSEDKGGDGSEEERAIRCFWSYTMNSSTQKAYMKCVWDSYLLQKGENQCQSESHVDVFDYADFIRHQLEKHHISSQHLHLNVHDLNQDSMTEWLEYLAWEYLHLDHLQNELTTKHKPRHDTAWAKLKRSKVLRPEDTYNQVKSPSFHQKANQTLRWTQSSLKRAKFNADRVATLKRDETYRKTTSQVDRMQTLAESIDILQAANARYVKACKFSKAIYDFYSEAAEYLVQRRTVEEHLALAVRWTRDQVSVVEIECQLEPAAALPLVAVVVLVGGGGLVAKQQVGNGKKRRLMDVDESEKNDKPRRSLRIASRKARRK